MTGEAPRPARRSRGLLVGLAVALGLAFAASLLLGSVPIAAGDVVGALSGADVTATVRTVVVELRLPRALAAVLGGAALAVAGALLQTLFRNPLAGPSVLGLSAGASLGVALVVLTAASAGRVGTTLAASLGAGAVLGLALAASRRVGTVTLLVLGLLLGYAISALVTVLLHFAAAERIQLFVVWTFGSFGGVDRGDLAVLGPVVVLGLLGAWALAKPLDALLLGEEAAQSLGVPVRALRGALLATSAVLAGAVTAFCGPVAFVGIVVPHLARAAVGTSRHAVALPASAAVGGLIALLADLASRLPGTDTTLPLNAVLALLGAPVVAFVVLGRRGLGEELG